MRLEATVDWVLSGNEWLRGWVEPALNEELRGYWRATQRETEEAEREATADATVRAMDIVADGAFTLRHRIQEAIDARPNR
jgi:hypothetical protein